MTAPVAAPTFGAFDFGLDAAQEERAARLHREAVVVDMLFQGPCGYRSFSPEMVAELEGMWAADPDHHRQFAPMVDVPIRWALEGRCDDVEAVWRASGITAANRQVAIGDEAETLASFARVTRQFDGFPWLVKALCAHDIRRAKAEGLAAGYVSTQNVDRMPADVDVLDTWHRLGLRMLQLTYNRMNLVGGGCTEPTDIGLSHFGTAVVRRMNELGIIVDTGHCGRRTTLDACEVSERPVVASHTSAASVYLHDRAKSDDELRAIAITDGVIGVYAVPFFLGAGPGLTIQKMLDHVEYIAELVGPGHVGIGTDWPLQLPKWALRDVLGPWGLAEGFRAEHDLDPDRNLVGFDDYRDLPNITRGLVARGFDDQDVLGILGGNFLRVFEAACG